MSHESDDTAQNLRLDTLEREMKEVRKILLVGNGSPPLTSRVAALEKTLNTHTWLLRLILGAVLTSLVKQFLP